MAYTNTSYETFREKLITKLCNRFSGSDGIERVDLLLAGYKPKDPYEAKDIKLLNIRTYETDDDALARDTIRMTTVEHNELRNSVRVPVEMLYGLYCQYQWPAVFNYIESVVRTNTSIDLGIVEKLGDFSVAKPKLTLLCRNVVRAGIPQTDYIHQRIEDFAIILYIELGTSENGCSFKAAVSRELFQKWGVSEDEAIEIATQNVIANRAVLLGSTAEAMAKDECDVSLYNLRTPDGRKKAKAAVNGGRAFITSQDPNDIPILALMPDVLEHIAEVYGGDFYVIFISEDDVVIEPATMPQAAIRAGLRNSKIHGYKPMLTDCFLLYDSAKKKFRIKK